MTHKRLISAGFGLAGISLLTGLIIYLGAGRTVHTLQNVSVTGFLVYLAAQLLIVAGLALSWRFVLRSRRKGSFALLYWGRLLRDAAGEFLPFSHLGGFIVGARAISLYGVSIADAAASTIVDITAEFLAELIFIALGLAILARRAPHSALVMPVAIGLAVAVAGGVGFIIAQHGGGRIFRLLATRIAGQGGESAALRMDRLQLALDEIYQRPSRVALAATTHLLSWFGTGTAAYFGLRALGHPITYLSALGIEALLHAILSAGFLVPGRIGVQEAAYAVVGSIFGVPPDLALSLSLLRRARDFIIAAPVLLAWQGIEARRLRVVTPS